MTNPRTLVVDHADCLATMDDKRTEWRDASLLVRGHVIEWVGPAAELPEEARATADEVIDARGHVVIPGLVNTHHHMFQSLTRVIPAAQDAELFGWLRALYPIWKRVTPEMIYVSTQTAMAELLFSGCTTSSDHLYLYVNGSKLDDSIAAADAIGMRFHAARGSMSLGESKGGVPPDAVVEDEASVLVDTQRLIERYDDRSRYSMLRVVVAPCSPFTVSPELMRQSVLLARSLGARLHTHLAENDHDVSYGLEKFGKTPTEYADSVGFLGDDCWHAHCVKLDEDGIRRFAATGTGVAHCPSSNMRLASGIAPVRRFLDAGVPVGLGVDGSASNDAGHLLNEARQALLLARVGRAEKAAFGCDVGPREMTARDVLALGTRGGARVLGRDDIGVIAPGMAADLAIYDVRTLAFAGGAVHDPIAALALCSSPSTAYTIVNGRVVVRQGELMTVPLRPLVERHNALARALANG
jgi:cytosine/adenosine deaminase-related metal-dependent hydrolase